VLLPAIPVADRVQTIASCNFASSRSLVSYVEQQQDSMRHVLIVGGNDKNGSSLTSTEAIRALTTSARFQDNDQNDKMVVWGVANPNCPSSVESVRAKVEAGAKGFITQPLLSSRAMETLYRYNDVALAHSPDTTIVAGMAFPTSVQSLQFWNGLLDETLSGDDEFERHVFYFAKHANTAPNDNGSTASTTWAVEHAQWISSKMVVDHGLCSGIHYMPMRNTRDWLAVLSKLDEQNASP
jgi:hypothetical protein